MGYISQTRAALDLWDIFGGVLKAVVFGFIVSVIACERGLATTGGAEGVGRSTTAAVVAILFHLILMDTLFSILFQQFGI
jgi:phospholipid/cholesterol/gamma-HCH transport system permease protein